MNRTLLITTIGLLTAAALGDPGILPVRGMQYGSYNFATREFAPTIGPERSGDSVWAATERHGYYYAQMAAGPGTITLDWGDIVGPQDIGAFAISYATDLLLPERLTTVVVFYAEENGRNSSGRVALAGFEATDLPTGGPTWNGWTVTFQLDLAGSAFVIDGSDLDFDFLTDFGYSYHFADLTSTPNNLTGPAIAGDPNLEGRGMEGVFDVFYDADLTSYGGQTWFGGTPFAQLYMELFESAVPSFCPEPGASGEHCWADIAGGTCVVDLADLAVLLANYGTTSGATFDMGDLDPNGFSPFGGDGDVDLADLAVLLGQYGDDCRGIFQTSDAVLIPE